MGKITESPRTAPHTATESMLPHLAENADLLCCPGCAGDLKIEDGAISCLNCGHIFGCEDRIALLFWPNQWASGRRDVTEIEKSFYEAHPFPNYDDADSVATLADKARAGIFAHLLDQQVPVRATILEVGCGTGRLRPGGQQWGTAAHTPVLNSCHDKRASGSIRSSAAALLSTICCVSNPAACNRLRIVVGLQQYR